MGLEHNASIVRSGLVLYLDAANRKSYPSSGTTWTDLSGQSNNGTLTNGPAFNNSNGGSIVFDGTNDNVSIAGNTSADFGPSTNAFTIDIWYRSNISSLRTVNSALYDRYRYYVYHDYVNNRALLSYVKKEWETTTNFVVNTCFATGLNPKGSWNNVTFSYVKSLENGTITGYSNGIFRNTSTDTRMSSYPLDTHFLGNSNHSNYSYYSFDGNISTIKVYNRALTAAEVRQNFEAHRDRYGI